MVQQAQQKAYERAVARQRAAELSAQQQAAAQELQQASQSLEMAQSRMRDQEQKQKALQQEYHQKAVSEAYEGLKQAQQKYYDLMETPQKRPEQLKVVIRRGPRSTRSSRQCSIPRPRPRRVTASKFPRRDSLSHMVSRKHNPMGSSPPHLLRPAVSCSGWNSRGSFGPPADGPFSDQTRAGNPNSDHAPATAATAG